MYFLLYEMSVSKVKSNEALANNMAKSLKSLSDVLIGLIGAPADLASRLTALIGSYLQKNNEIGITKFHYRVVLEVSPEDNIDEINSLLNEMLEKKNEEPLIPPALLDEDVEGKVFVNCNQINQDDICKVKFKGSKISQLGKSYNLMAVFNESAVTMQDKKTPESMSEFKSDSE